MTPELFPSSGKFIIPGVTNPSNLQQAVEHISRLQDGTEDREAADVDDSALSNGQGAQRDTKQN